MKKCRARYGLDQQNLWCKPCRRKKKCIRVQMYLAGRTEQEIEATTFDEEGEAITPLGSGALLPASGVTNSCSSHGSDGEGGSPASQGGSIEFSEHSLTSPATPGGGMSIPSLGSPASIASPSTPGGSEDWFRTSVGYRPPVSNHRPVGTDPRDSKNPLSISSLTSCHSRENGLNGNDKMLGVTWTWRGCRLPWIASKKLWLVRVWTQLASPGCSYWDLLELSFLQFCDNLE